MLIKINSKNEITDYAVIGSLPNSIEISDDLKPSDFDDNFKSGYYLFQDDQIVVNPNYEEPTVSAPTPEPSEPSKEWQAINMLALQVAQLKAEKGGAQYV